MLVLGGDPARARGLSVYQVVLFGAQAAGAAIWRVAAETSGLVPAFLMSAVVMAVGAAQTGHYLTIDVRE